MKTITLIKLLLIVSIVFLLISCEVEEQERAVTADEVPQTVFKSFNKAYPGAAIKEYSEEIENGQTFYEISCTYEGRTIDAVYNPDGSVFAIEEVISAEALPEIIHQAMAKEVAQFSIKLAEKIEKGGETFYEVKILNTQDQKTYELQFSDTGKLIEQE